MRLFDPNTFDTSSIAPLLLKKFWTFVIVPIVGCYLIHKDMECSLADAYNHMSDSAEVGDMLQDMADEEDEEMDNIHLANMRKARREREGYVEPTGPILKVRISHFVGLY